MSYTLPFPSYVFRPSSANLNRVDRRQWRAATADGNGRSTKLRSPVLGIYPSERLTLSNGQTGKTAQRM